MSKTNAFEELLLLLLFNNTTIADFGDATGLVGSSVAGSLYFTLHTANPGEAGSATMYETTYTNYVRVAAARSGAGFTVTNNSVSPAANVDFAECGVTPGDPITHFGVVLESSGTAVMLYYGTVTPNITMAAGVIPRLKTTSTITED